jgi:DNA-binding MurR/RpiR family transcriptional regulator
MFAVKPLPARPAPPDILRRIRSAFDTLTPELQRAAQWVTDHPSDTGFLSMRQQAKSAGVSAPTMVRLARALGFDDYASLRRPFQDAMAGRSLEYRSRASALQSTPASAEADNLGAQLSRTQLDDVQSVQSLNKPDKVDAAVDAVRKARRVGFLGVRASFGIAFQFRYAYNLIARNGVLFDGLAGTVQDQVDALETGDVLIAISQTPYSVPTVQSVQSAVARGVTVVALTDSALSPLARGAKHVLLFRADSVSFFPSMIGPLALVELLLAQLAAKGGKSVLKRLAEVEERLTRQQAYWRPVRKAVP